MNEFSDASGFHDQGFGPQPGNASLPSQSDDIPNVDEMRHYISSLDEGLEDISQYCEGGFHPIHIGDVLNDRFEVVNKLGNGGFGIVWLCLDQHLHKWRAVKVMMANHSSKRRDTKVIKHLKSQASIDELLDNGIAVPLEEFWINGQNGSHHCFVMPVLGCSIDEWRDSLHWTQYESGSQARQTCRQVVKALHFLHKHGVCHGDFRPANILMQAEGLDNLDKPALYRILGKPETRRLTKDHSHTKARPDYCVVPISEDSSRWRKLITAKIAVIDYGESFLMGDSKELCGIPMPYAAPELLFGGSPSAKSDIWALVCTLYQIRVSNQLFDIGGWEADEISDIVGELELPLGPLPEPYRTAWYQKGYGKDGYEDDESDREQEEEDPVTSEDPQVQVKDGPVVYRSVEDIITTRQKMKSEAGVETVFQAIAGEERQIAKVEPDASDDWMDLDDSDLYHKYRYSRQEITDLADILEGVLKWDPTERMSLDEILHHPWLREPNTPKVTRAVSVFSARQKQILGWVSLLLVVIFPVYMVIYHLHQQTGNGQLEIVELLHSMLHNYPNSVAKQNGGFGLHSCYCHIPEGFYGNLGL